MRSVSLAHAALYLALFIMVAVLLAADGALLLRLLAA